MNLNKLKKTFRINLYAIYFGIIISFSFLVFLTFWFIYALVNFNIDQQSIITISVFYIVALIFLLIILFFNWKFLNFLYINKKYVTSYLKISNKNEKKIDRKIDETNDFQFQYSKFYHFILIIFSIASIVITIFSFFYNNSLIINDFHINKWLFGISFLVYCYNLFIGCYFFITNKKLNKLLLISRFYKFNNRKKNN
ncbi:hypothetical protein [Mycoplasma sp. SG1]|uniref:hypothetical protein n=1 Tax=Mycoplasma sp. SG1 TaxID=2810348 RepID=UPI0020242A92|nr:hypothetical protein [Mycoplasma sp. SG1]URM53125.1 hypothetical protein JRW51_02130 [Mycoplasma sp. SG1]